MDGISGYPLRTTNHVRISTTNADTIIIHRVQTLLRRHTRALLLVRRKPPYLQGMPWPNPLLRGR